MRKFHSTDPTTAAYNAIVSFILLFGVLDMFTKVVVGLVAAIAVAGAGVYYAQSDSSGCKGGCPRAQLSRLASSQVLATGSPADVHHHACHNVMRRQRCAS